MGVSSKMSVCCLSVCLSVCDEFAPYYLLNHLSDWAKKIFTQTRENVYLIFCLRKKLGLIQGKKYLAQK